MITNWEHSLRLEAGLTHLVEHECELLVALLLLGDALLVVLHLRLHAADLLLLHTVGGGGGGGGAESV